MPTVITPIRSDNAYFGFSKETTPGTPVAPTYFPRWMDGSNISLDLKAEDVWEGDGSRHLSQIIKNQQSVKIKLSFTPRANELGFFECAAMGVSSDAYTAPTVNTSLSSPVSAGATSISVASATGIPTSSTISLVLAAGTASEEIVPFTTPASGTTLTVAAAYNFGNGLKYAHTTSPSTSVQSSATHVLTDQTDGNYYTIEVGLGSLNGANGTTLRVRTCKVETIKRSAKAGGLLMYEIDFAGIATAVQGSPSTITLEQHSVFLYTQGTWTIDGSTGNAGNPDALDIETFDVEQKNNLDTSIQTEQLTNAALIFGNLDVSLGFELVYTNANKIYQTYFGSTTGTVDAQAVGLGSFNVTFTQADGFQSVTYAITTTTYTKDGIPAPKKDGKHFKQSVSATSVSNMGVNAYLLQTTVTNTQYASY